MLEVRRLSLGIYEEMVGRVDSVSEDEHAIRITLSVPARLLEIPKSEAEFEPSKIGKKVGILNQK